MMVPPELIADAFASVQRELDFANQEIVKLKDELETLRDGVRELIAEWDTAAIELGKLLPEGEDLDALLLEELPPENIPEEEDTIQ